MPRPQFRMAAAATVAACVSAAAFHGAAAFLIASPTTPSETAGPLLKSPSLARGTAHLRGQASEASSSNASLLPSVGLLASLAGVAALASKSRNSRGAVSRKVTLQEIQNLTAEKVPENWARKVNLGMARRYELCDAIKAKLDESFFVMAINRDDMVEKQLAEARKMFPPQVTVRSLKGNLVKKAMEGTEWEVLTPHLRGSNLYIFVPEDTYLKPTIEAYLKLEKEFNREEKIAAINERYARVGMKGGFQLTTTCPGGVMRDEWNHIPKKDLAKLKNFPTKLEMIAQIAGAIKQVPQKLAVCSKQLPQKLAIGTKKIVEKMEEEGKDSVADVAV